MRFPHPAALGVHTTRPATDAAALPRTDTRGTDARRSTQIRRCLLTGVGYMIPFVVAGGLLETLGLLLAGHQTTASSAAIVAEQSLADPTRYVGAVFFTLGALALGLLVPALAGYIAFAVADRPGIMPGFTVGLMATTVGAGYLGGLAGGLLAGVVARWLAGVPAPRWLRGVMPVVVVPVGTTILAGGLMAVVLGPPLAAVTRGLDSTLAGLAGGSALLLGAILGVMMAFDLGGPLNKTAYLFATAGLAGGSVPGHARPTVLAAVMTAGMVPPLALALATAVRPASFSAAEQQSGEAAWLLGGAFITEGAIPFAAADPLRVIPAITCGAATAGALTLWAGVTLAAPHGGLLALFAIGNIAMFLLALVAGTLVAAAAVLAAKQLLPSPAVGAA